VIMQCSGSLLQLPAGWGWRGADWQNPGFRWFLCEENVGALHDRNFIFTVTLARGLRVFSCHSRHYLKHGPLPLCSVEVLPMYVASQFSKFRRFFGRMGINAIISVMKYNPNVSPDKTLTTLFRNFRNERSLLVSFG
jgi:hypothetical protein